jgi:hypothetical protein
VVSLPRFTDGISIGVLTRLFPRDLVDEVLAQTGRLEKRTRLLPARVVVYYVLALCLFFGDGYEEVMRKLVNGLTFLRTWRQEWRVPTTSAISQARQRLGAEPLRELFDRVAVPLAAPGMKGAWFHGWRVMAVDGVILDVPDTDANVAEFTKYAYGGGDSPYPQIRVVGLGECGTHAIVAAAVDSWTVYEREMFERIIPELTPDMLVLCDRGFFSYDLWTHAAATGAELVWRIRDTIDLEVLDVLPDGSFRSELVPKRQKADLKRGKLRRIPDHLKIPVRVVEYTVTDRGENNETFRLVTSIEDWDLAPATELAELYHQRWEFELVLDEIETHQMSHTRLLRSKSPELVRQEIWALLLTHYAVRAFMSEATEELYQGRSLDPDQLSFTRSLNVIRRQVTNQAGFSPSPPPKSDHRRHR